MDISVRQATGDAGLQVGPRQGGLARVERTDAAGCRACRGARLRRGAGAAPSSCSPRRTAGATRCRGPGGGGGGGPVRTAPEALAVPAAGVSGDRGRRPFRRGRAAGGAVTSAGGVRGGGSRRVGRRRAGRRVRVSRPAPLLLRQTGSRGRLGGLHGSPPPG